ncbi:MAG: cobalamin-dependent protein, partial [Candidatus Binatia bacterium]
MGSAARPAAAVDLDDATTLLRAQFPSGLTRVLLVNPPDADSGLFRVDAAQRGVVPNFPPYGLAVLAQHLRAVGVEVRIVNLNHAVLKACRETPAAAFEFDAVWQGALDAALAAFAPELIGVTCMFTMTHESLRQVCTWAARGGIPVAIGGVHVTNDVERVLDDIPAARFAFLREADRAVQH